MTKLSEKVQQAINDQINMEFQASYNYLAMSGFCALNNFPGCAQWLQTQSEEEGEHAMRLREFLLDRDCSIELQPIKAPTADYTTIPEVFAAALRSEIKVSASIDKLYELAHQEKAFAALVEVQWFITEQVEEEKTVRDIAARFEMLKDDPSGLIDMDNDLGDRKSEEE